MRPANKHTLQFPINLLHTVISIFDQAEIITNRRGNMSSFVRQAYYGGDSNLYARLLRFTNTASHVNVICDKKTEFDCEVIKQVRIPFDTALTNAQTCGNDENAAVNVVLTRKEAQNARSILLRFTTNRYDAIFQFIAVALTEKSPDYEQVNDELKAYLIMTQSPEHATVLTDYNLIFRPVFTRNK